MVRHMIQYKDDYSDNVFLSINILSENLEF